jgi:hypothetical protein
MASSELNKLSKRQILESLYYEQSQSTATLSRFFTAIARIQGINPGDLAKAFAEDEKNQEYVQKFNTTLREMQAEKSQANKPSEAIKNDQQSNNQNP